MERYYELMKTPIGEICILTTKEQVTNILLFEEEWKAHLLEHLELIRGGELCIKVVLQLEEYFCGKRKSFDVPINLSGTPYRMKVWEEVSQIGYGEVVSYQEIANRIQNPRSVRAIGQANKANPIPIIIPCHRVIGKDGKLVGYAGDRVKTKLDLLNHEKNNMN